MNRLLTVLVLMAAAVAARAQEPHGVVTETDAVREVLDRQCRPWRGRLVLQQADGAMRSLPLRYELRARDGGYEGEMLIEDPDNSQSLLRIPINVHPDDGRGILADFGESKAWRGGVPRDLRGKPRERTVLWTGHEGGFQMALDHEAFELTIAGRPPLPESLRTNVVWTHAELDREGFRLVVGPFSITLMECLGVFATLFFASRFLIQWVASERAKKSVVPELFWWVSLLGSGLMIVYGIYFGRFAVLLGQTFGWVVYVRNIWLIEIDKRRAHLSDGDMPVVESKQEEEKNAR